MVSKIKGKYNQINQVWEKRQTKNTKQNLYIRNTFILKKKNKIEDRIIRDIWKPYGTEEQLAERKKLERKKRNYW